MRCQDEEGMILSFISMYLRVFSTQPFLGELQGKLDDNSVWITLWVTQKTDLYVTISQVENGLRAVGCEACKLQEKPGGDHDQTSLLCSWEACLVL